jgi:hypothetical protein
MVDLRCILGMVASRAHLASWWWTRCGKCDEIITPAHLTMIGPNQIDMVFRGHLHLEELTITIGAPA